MKKIPLKQFFKNRERYNFDFSPNLKKIAFISKYKNRTNIFIKDMKTGKEKVITTQQVRNIANYDWKGNDKLLYLQDNNGDENYHLYIVDINTKQVEDLTPWKNVKVFNFDSLNAEYFVKKKDKYKNKIIVYHNKRHKGIHDFYFVDINTKKHHLFSQNTLQSQKEIFDLDNEEFIYKSTTEVGGKTIHFIKGNKRKKILFVSSRDFFEILGLDESKKNVYFLSNIERDKTALFKIDLEFKNKPKLIFEHNEVDLLGLKINFLTRKLEFVSYYLDRKRIHYFDDKLKDEHNECKKILYKKFPQEKENNVVIWKDIFNNKIFQIVTIADNKLNSEYYIDFEKKEVFKLTIDDDYLIPKNLANMKYISYKARDGLIIHGYLTLPKNAKGPVPIIIHPHGGPWVRDYWQFNSEIQFLANNGYGVFQPNFRISTGYGKEHFVKGWKQWGKSCQDDITDGTMWLINQGYTKHGMIGIYGGSYGGYATLMGIIREPKLYSAAVDYVGVSDLFSFWDGFPEYWKQKGNIFEEAMGNPYKNKKLAIEVSPIYHIDKIQTPLMVVQGGMDPRVPQKQAELIVNGIRKNGGKVEYILKKDEGHGFSNQENKFEFYKKMIKFFDKYLKNKS